MSQENIDRLRAGYEAFNETGEIGVEHLARDFEMRQASSIIDTAGVFHGQDALRDALRELRDSFEWLTFEAEKFIEAPEGEVVVLIRARGRGQGSGVEIDNPIAHVWTFRDDKAVGLVVYEDRAEAMEAVGVTG